MSCGDKLAGHVNCRTVPYEEEEEEEEHEGEVFV